MQLLHRITLLPLKKTKTSPEMHSFQEAQAWRVPRPAVWQKRCRRSTQSLVAAQAPSCLPALQRLSGDKLTGLKVCHATASRVYSRPPCRVEGPLNSRGESWRWCTSNGKRSWSYCVNGGWHTSQSAEVRRLIIPSRSQNSLLQQNKPSSPSTRGPK